MTLYLLIVENQSNSESNRLNQHYMIETSRSIGPEVYDLFNLMKHHIESIITEIMMDGKSINIEVDKGAAIIIIVRNTFKQHYNAQQELSTTSDVLRPYTGQ